MFVRIGKKISKVAKKVLFFPFKGTKSSSGDCQLSIMDGGESYIVSLPKSPASLSGLSTGSSLMTGNTSGANRIIGAVPPQHENPAAHQLLYGAISYDMTSAEGSTNGSDALPPPPARTSLPRPVASCDDEDVVGYLAKAMKPQGEEDNAESVLLLVAPKDDHTGLEVISAPDGTPVHVRDLIDAERVKQSLGEDDDAESVLLLETPKDDHAGLEAVPQMGHPCTCETLLTRKATNTRTRTQWSSPTIWPVYLLTRRATQSTIVQQPNYGCGRGRR